ncbi:putative membrane protein [Mycolicibacterium fortuitum]|uniref:Putative membrane protein n=1 Tax=Mycolicibacterium fortuitum TaxID=1766 RepID=A0A0N9YJZ7_MYCFO|nr:AzlD domain-containing protein [Mycolicibacterium fortuitum]ALI28458.1 putative membrane protein [Mycolicibacterium fortuitum]MBP3085258.1 AzlD domain-containing protein [Mycolicibacterium fortuitum]
MPEGAGHIALLVGVAAGITWALRALPFAVLAPMRHSTVVRYLSTHMPLGVMAMLAIYTLRGHTDGSTRQLLWLGIAVACTAVLHWVRGSALLSILAGTTLYVVLMSLWA